MSNETDCQNSGCWLMAPTKDSGCLSNHNGRECPKFTSTPTTSIPTAELAELKADRELYYNLAYERANEIINLKQDICNRDEANRVMVGEVGKLKKENAELKADREMLDFIEQKIDMILRPVPANKSSKGWMVSGLDYGAESIFGKTIREAITKAMKG